MVSLVNNILVPGSWFSVIFVVMNPVEVSCSSVVAQPQVSSPRAPAHTVDSVEVFEVTGEVLEDSHAAHVHQLHTTLLVHTRHGQHLSIVIEPEIINLIN